MGSDGEIAPFTRLNWERVIEEYLMDTENPLVPREVARFVTTYKDFTDYWPLDDNGFTKLRDDILYTIAIEAIEILTGNDGELPVKLLWLSSRI